MLVLGYLDTEQKALLVGPGPFETEADPTDVDSLAFIWFSSHATFGNLDQPKSGEVIAFGAVSSDAEVEMGLVMVGRRQGGIVHTHLMKQLRQSLYL